MSTSCKDCKVARGYRPILDYVEMCPLHAAAPELLAALKASALFAHERGRYDSGSFAKCQRAECVAAREAIGKAEEIQ